MCWICVWRDAVGLFALIILNGGDGGSWWFMPISYKNYKDFSFWNNKMHVINPYERFDVEDSDVTTSGDYENDYFGPIDGVIISDDEDYNIEKSD